MKILWVVCLLMCSACASINSVSLTPIPTQRGTVVTAEVSKTVFLAFNFDNDFVNSLVGELKQKCPGGFVSGILTKDEVYSYVIVFTRKVTATGFCSTSVARNNRPTRSSASVEDSDSPTQGD